jgi:hypothetical protein
MASHASSAATMSLETGPEQLPVNPRLAPAEPPAAKQRDPLRPLEVAQCSLCGLALPLGLLVPDGGQACADIRWYCKDARSCTERWTTARPPERVHTPAIPGNAFTSAREVAPYGTSAADAPGPRSPFWPPAATSASLPVTEHPCADLALAQPAKTLPASP